MKKFLSLVIIIVLLASGLSACSADSPQDSDKDDTLRIVTTIFPEYDWVMNIVAGRLGKVEVVFLLDNGTDLHSFQPSADDILTISTSDLFIYVGGESDQWVKDVLSEAINPDMAVINLLDELGDMAKEEELTEGMEGEPEDADYTDDEAEPEYDEHVWLSLQNASFLASRIAEVLAEIDSSNADIYRKNAQTYIDMIAELDERYQAVVAEAEVNTLLFGDRFPFRYLVDDYGLDYYAAFAGCSAETEASFETIVFLADKVDELSLPAILTIDGSDHRIAETIRDNTAAKNQQILTMDSMQAITGKAISDGTSYLSIMESNLQVLQDALTIQKTD